MLVSFKVNNFRSFKDTAELLMKASISKEHPENLIETVWGTRLLKSAVIYGANAAGKSNLIKALVAAIMIVRTSTSRQIDATIPFIEPFAFSGIMNPYCSFEFEFIAEKKRYIYGFSCSNEKINEEYLTIYTSQRPTKVFLRKNEEYVFFSMETSRVLKPLTERNTPNKLFLATATNWNAEITKTPFLWLNKFIDVFDSEQTILQSLELYEADKNGELKEFTTKLLKESDLNINDYTIETRIVDNAISQLVSRIPTKEYKVLSEHFIKSKEGKNTTYNLPMANESKGTQNLFFLSPQIKRALDNGYVFCVDELDSSMHPDLLCYLIRLFNSEEMNPNGAQLIVTLHTTEAMSLKLLRREQIYFVDKDNDTGESELYSLDDFPVRLNEDVRKAYLSGRFGAVPDII